MNRFLSLYLIAIAVAVCTLSVQGGRVYSWGEPLIRHPNKSKLTSITIFFALDSPLAKGNVIRITLPFTNSVVANNAVIRWGEITTGIRGIDILGNDILTKEDRVNYVTGSAPYAISITMNADSLAARRNYALNIPISTPPSDAPGFIGYIKVETLSPSPSVLTSATNDNPIHYDSNAYFAPVQLYDAPATLTFSVAGTDTNRANAGANWQASISVKPTADVWPRSTISITWDNSNFKVANCLAYDTGASTSAVTAFPDSAAFSCTIKDTTILIHQNIPLLKNQTYVYRVNITNPSLTTASSTTFSATVMYRYNQNITDVGTSAALTANAVTTTTTTTTSTAVTLTAKILLSWGIDPVESLKVNGATAASGPLKKVFGIHAYATVGVFYQALRFSFTPSAALSGSTYSIAVALDAVANVFVLENSITTSGIVLTSKGCTVSTSGTRTITCEASSIPQSECIIAARVSVKTGGVVATFGQVTISSTSLSSSIVGTPAAEYRVEIANNGIGQSIGTSSGVLTAYPQTWDAQMRATASVDYTLPANWKTFYSNIVGQTSVTQYSVSLPTQLKYASGSVTAPESNTVFATSAVSAVAAKQGVDLFLNPNLWTAPSSSTGLTTCKFQNAPYVVPGGATASTTCYPNPATSASANQYCRGASSATPVCGGSATCGTSGSATDCYPTTVTQATADTYCLGGTTNTPCCNSVNSAATCTSIVGTSCATDRSAGKNVIGSSSLHCQMAQSTAWTRLRMVTTSANGVTGNAVDATNTINAAADKYPTFFWPSSVSSAAAFAGASLVANTLVGDYYAIFYILPSTTTQPAATTAASQTDLGELSDQTAGSGKTALTLATGDVGSALFFSQAILPPPNTIDPAASGTPPTLPYQSVAAFITNYYGASAPNTDSMVAVWNIRGGLISADANPGTNAGGLAFFYDTQINFLAPISATASAYSSSTVLALNAISCGNGGATSVGSSVCSVRNSLKSVTWTGISATNKLDTYGLVATDYTGYNVTATAGATLTTSAPSFRVYFAVASTASNTGAAITGLGNIRLAFATKTAGMYYIAYSDLAAHASAATAELAVTTGSPTTALNDAGVLVPASGNCALTGSSQPAVFVNSDPASNGVGAKIGTAKISYKLDRAYQSGSIAPGTAAARGGVTFCAVDWNFMSSSDFSASLLTTSNNGCWGFNYLSTQTGNKKVYCLFCPWGGTNPSTTIANISASNLMAYPNTDVQVATFGAVTNDWGRVLTAQSCPITTGSFLAGNASISSASSWLNINGQKLTATFNLPSGLALADRISVTAYEAGTPATSTGTQNTSFPWINTPDSTNLVCRFAPTLTPENALAAQSCTLEISGGSFIVKDFGTPTGTSFTLWAWGLVGSNPDPVPTSKLVQVKSYKTVSSVDGTVDISPTANAPTWSFTKWTNADFTVTGTTWQRSWLEGKGTVRWDFTIAQSRPLFHRDIIKFNIDAFSTASENNLASSLRCKITDASDNLIQVFQECTFATGAANSITIKGYNSGISTLFFELPSSTWRVWLEGVRGVAPAGTNKGIYGSIQYGTLSGTVQTRAANTNADFTLVTLPTTTAFPTGLPTIIKTYNNFGIDQDIAFNLSSGANGINDSCVINIIFPSYYQPGLTNEWGTPNCWIGAVAVNCVINRELELVVTGPNVAVAASTNFTLRIQGITSSQKSGSAVERFYIVINGDNKGTDKSIIYQGYVNDVDGVSTNPAVINVNLGLASTTDTRTVSTYTWNFVIPADAPTTSTVQVIFPRIWGLGSIFTPACKVYDAFAASTSLTGTQTVSGPYVNLVIAAVITKNSPLVLECSGIRNPDAGRYRPRDIEIRIIDTNSLVSSRSVPTVHNTDFSLEFKPKAGFTDTNFQAALSTSMSAPTELKRGVYSDEIAFLTTEIPSRTFTVTLLGQNFVLMPSAVNVTIGQPHDSRFRVGVNTATALGNYALTFTHTDTSKYLQPPIAFVHVTASQAAIRRQRTGDFSAIIGSSTLPVVFDVQLNPPVSDVTLTAGFDGVTVFSVSPATITLTAARPFGSFVFKTISSAVAGNTTKVVYTVAGTNKDSFAAPAGHSLKVDADTNNQATVVPTLVVAEKTADTRKATSKIVYATLDKVDTATLYYCVAFPAQGFSLNQIWGWALNSTVPPVAPMESDNTQRQCSMQILNKGENTITINFLKPNTRYEITAFVNSLFNQNSTLTTFAFITNSNGGAINRVLFNFASYPTASVRQTLLCELSKQLTAPSSKIISIHGDFCNGGMVFYSSTNSSNGLAVYFFPSDTEDDTITKNLAKNLDGIKTSLNTSLTTSAGWWSYQLDGVILPVAPAAISGSASATQNSVSVSAIQPNQTAYVYIGYEASSTANTPSPSQLRAGLNGANSPLAGTFNTYYLGGGSAISQTFSNLNTNTTYQVYAVATSGEPSPSSAATAVITLSATTSTPTNTTTTTNAFTLFASVLFALVGAFVYLL